MRLRSSAKRIHKPSAFAPAVGVKQGVPSSHSGAVSSSTLNDTMASSPSIGGRAAATSSIKSAIVHLTSGGLAAGLVRASLQPLDTCKTRLQAARLSSTITATATAAATPMRAILLAGGVRGLYRGVVPGVAGIIPAAAVYMLAFQTLRARLGTRFPRRRNDVVVAVSAGIADVAATLVRVPCEVLKQRLQIGLYPNVVSALRSIITTPSAIPRLYVGLSAQLVRDVPHAATEFVVYENLKSLALRRLRRQHQKIERNSSVDYGAAAQHLQHRTQDTKLDRPSALVIGAVAGAFAAIISNPADVVKTRLMTQMQSSNPKSAFSPIITPAPLYRSVRDAFARIAREEGISAFAKGITPRIAAKALQSALFFATYEGLRRAIGGALKVDANSTQKSPH